MLAVSLGGGDAKGPSLLEPFQAGELNGAMGEGHVDFSFKLPQGLTR